MLNADATGLVEDVVKSATQGALAAVYWNLRDHAAAYRNAKAFKLSYENWRNNRHGPTSYERHAVHEFYARGIEAAAREVADMMGVPECEIEREVEDASYASKDDVQAEVASSTG